MSNPFVLLYKLFESRKVVFYSLLIIVLFSFVFLGFRLVLKEDLAAFIPKDQKLKKYKDVIQNLKANDRIIMNVSIKDTTITDPDALTEYAEVFSERLRNRFDTTWIKEVKYKIEEETAADVFGLLYSSLPYYMDKEDYAELESRLTDTAIYTRLKSNYETILSPEGAILKNYLIQDPLGMNNYALAKLSRLQSEENFQLYNGYFLTNNRKNLFLYVSTGYPSSNSNRNLVLIEGIKQEIQHLEDSAYQNIHTEYFGSPAISASNVKQIKEDTVLTTIAALIIIFIGLFLYFKNIKTLMLIFLPVVFGGGFSLAVISLMIGEISAIAIGAGSIVLGIAINYSLHFFTHLKHERSVIRVIADLTLPLTIGCATTVGAFLCLNFMQSEALQDMGTFAALSLLGAAFCCLVILPQLAKSYEKKGVGNFKSGLLDKITAYPFHKNKVLLALVIVMTVVFAFTYDRVGFETDMIKLSYINPDLQKAENNLDKLTNYKLKSVFLVSHGKYLEEALTINARAKDKIKELTNQRVIKKYSDVGDFLMTDSAKKEKIRQWNNFWTKERIESLKDNLLKAGKEFHFKEAAFTPTFSLVEKEFIPENDSSSKILKDIFLQEYITQNEIGTSIITVLKVEEKDKEKIYQTFGSIGDLFVLDKGSTATLFAKVLNQDFNLILLLCASLVFGFLFISYGRIEITLLAFIPMMISWIWILGIMGLTDIKFNIVNIIICTFIFGLGDDFSIFTLDGLEQEYKYGKNVLASYRNSILLSAFTVIVGIGVLIFAKHPALHSIALVTIIGIFCIVFVSMVIQPLAYGWLIADRVKKGKLPITVQALLYSISLVFFFLVGILWIKLLAIFFREKSTVYAAKFISSLNSFKLFIERKCGENLTNGLVKKYIHYVPSATMEKLEANYVLQRKNIEPTSFYRGRLIKNYLYKGPVVEWYTRIKTALEDNYKTFDDLVPKKGKIVDVGCGYGYLSYMLSLTAPEREVTGIDYDEEKIAIAQNGVLRTSTLNFYASDVLDFNYEKSDAFIISDVLHYLTESNQAILIQKCLEKLNRGGVLIIREGNSEMKERHKGTKLTEFFSTKLLRFNKVAVDKLYFTSTEKITNTVSSYPVSVETLDNTQYTSNIIFIIRENKS